ncbi:MAG: L-fucose isomerase [Oscillospiraceae bacterium]|nr:L-fucose isomerase [Oscillospiraceae bacterium]
MNPLIGSNPKIGIRPCIDGRRDGVRESLEERTMAMAKAAAALIEGRLRHPNGDAVQCVVADTCIGGVAEAAMCEDKFSRENVTATLSVTPCWCYGSETMDQNPLTVKAVWGFNGTERPGAVYLAAVMSAHSRMGLPAFAIYGRDVQDMDDASIPEDVTQSILRFAKCALAAGWMRGKSYCNIGAVSMGISGSYADEAMLRKTFGMRTEWVDQIELERRIARGIYDPAEVEKALQWTKKHCKEGADRNKTPFSREEKDAQWERCVKTAVIVKDIMRGNPRLAELGFAEEAMGRNAIAAGVQGQRQWTDHFPNHDFAEAILASSFDWNGPRQPLTVATENDVLNAVSMLLGHLLNGRASVFADVRTYWSPDAVERVTGWKPDGIAADGFIHLINSGAAALDGSGAIGTMKPHWDLTPDDIGTLLDATDWPPANREYFRGGGFSSRFETKIEMPLTMLRLCLAEGADPVLQIAEGHSAALPEKVSHTLWERTDPTWPCTWFVGVPPNPASGAGCLNGQASRPLSNYELMARWGANHGAFCYGHIGAELITLAAMLKIPVALHNVALDRIFRPHVWGMYGDPASQDADYRACASLK